MSSDKTMEIQLSSGLIVPREEVQKYSLMPKSGAEITWLEMIEIIKQEKPNKLRE